jgi:hypothetical protein
VSGFRPRLVAPSGFLNPLTLCSAPALPALFHAGLAYGVRSSELCSSRAAVRRLRRRAPLVVRPRINGPPFAPRSFRQTREHGAPPSGVGTTRESSACREQLRRARSPALLSFASPGRSLLRPWGGLHRPSPHALARCQATLQHRVRFRVSQSRRLGWPVSRLPALLRFLTFRPDPTIHPDVRSWTRDLEDRVTSPFPASSLRILCRSCLSSSGRHPSVTAAHDLAVSKI